jgi:superfamily II DNA or RNA helicase
MPPLRLSTGRSVTPLKRPNIAGAKGLQLDKARVLPLPKPEEIELSHSDETHGVQVSFDDLTPVQSIQIPIDPLEFEAASAVISELSTPAQALSSFELGDPQGIQFSSAFRREDEPVPMQRSYQQVWQAGQLQSDAEHNMLKLVAPFLQPALLSSEWANEVFPSPLLKHQKQALETLIRSEALMLADDPGTGRLESVCAAIAALVQGREIRRALVVTTRSRRRLWAHMAAGWCPGVAINIVRGNEEQRRMDWRVPAHLYVTSYGTVSDDLIESDDEFQVEPFDLIVLDAVHVLGLRIQGDKAGLVSQLQAPRRWAISGGLPQQAEDWYLVFGFLEPKEVQTFRGLTVPALQRRLEKYTLRRTKVEVAASLPRLRRRTQWIDLDPDHLRYYQEVLAEERLQLRKLGSSITRTHVIASVDRLKQCANFQEGSFDGAKSRALVDMVEEIVAGGNKVVVFSQFKNAGLEPLSKVLVPYGVVKIDSETSPQAMQRRLESFFSKPDSKVLLLEVGVRLGDQPFEAPHYVVHFDHAWNPAVRSRSERRLFPEMVTSVPVSAYEYWVAGTIDEKIYQLLARRDLLPEDLPTDTRPVDLDDQFSIREWLTDVFELDRERGPATPSTGQVIETNQLPGTGVLRRRLLDLEPGKLLEAVIRMLAALGYDNVERLEVVEEQGGDLLAWQVFEDDVARILVRYFRTSENIGVGDARKLLDAMEERGDCSAGYLITTSDFTPACRTLTEESGGRIELVGGSELFRHLHILGWL